MNNLTGRRCSHPPPPPWFFKKAKWVKSFFLVLHNSVFFLAVQLKLHLFSVGRWPSGSYCILANGKCPSGFSRYYGNMRVTRIGGGGSWVHIQKATFGDSGIVCYGRCYDAQLHITACCK